MSCGPIAVFPHMTPVRRRRAPSPIFRSILHAAASSAQRHHSDVRRNAASRWRRAECVRRRTALPRRAQRLGKIDTPARLPLGSSNPIAARSSCSRAPSSAICRKSPISPPMRRPSPTSRPASPRAMIRIAPAISCSSSASPATKIRDAVGRRVAARRARPRACPCAPILLLDEPTNHLDLPAIEWLEGPLAAESRRPRHHQP